MILKNENSIYMFYEAIEQLEPEKILDVGMFLKRTGAVSRKVMSRDIPEDRQLTGIDFFPELTFPVWNMIYDQIETAESYYKKQDTEKYDLAVVFGAEDFQKKVSMDKIITKTAHVSKYVLLDQWIPAWKSQKRFIRATDIKVENDIYFLAMFEE